MTSEEIEVVVMDGAALIQRWRCRRTTMPDGTPGAFWRGIAYPLLSGDRIDVGMPPPAEPATDYAVLPGEEASWVLLQGMPAAVEAARKAMERDGIVVLRTGRWLGEPVGTIAFDWFLCCAGSVDPQRLAGLLGRSAPASVEADSAARLAVQEQRIAGLLAELRRAEDELRRSMDVRRGHSSEPVPPAAAGISAAPDLALQNALAEIQALRASLETAAANPRLSAPPDPQAPQTVRARDEVGALLGCLRPDIMLIRDSLLVALGELHSRVGFYKALGELPLSGSRPEGWKMLRGAERWWERHISTGRNDHGRAYARFDTVTRKWSVLLSWKVDQPQDIAWLQRQG